MKKVMAGFSLLLIPIVCGPVFVRAQSEGVSGTWSGAWREAGMTENVRGSYDSGDGGSRHGDIKSLPIHGTLKGDQLTLESRDGAHRFATKRFDVSRAAK